MLGVLSILQNQITTLEDYLISENHDLDGDGLLSEEELLSITEVYIVNKSLNSVDGINKLKNLETLSINNLSKLKEIHLSSLTKLESLSLNSLNSLKSITLQKLPHLESFLILHTFENRISPVFLIVLDTLIFTLTFIFLISFGWDIIFLIYSHILLGSLE